jgi:hypothetical protein
MTDYINIVYVLWWWILGVAFARLMVAIFDDELDKKDVVKALRQFTLAGITVAAFVYLRK